MDADQDPTTQIVQASRDVNAPPRTIFALIADPARQPEWDGNDNLVEAPAGQRVHQVGDVFTMALTNGKTRENHVVEFEEDRLLAWKPASPGEPPAGHLWRWTLEPQADGTTRVTHTYDWSGLTDPARMDRARSTTADMLQSSVDRLAGRAEADASA
ncbi:SRPBCC family protein [Ornithinimicrobium sufpigmenti]|uniref:SRPBCC family protein n=1 Tax=Ornithinimicrobium sufpigmenti TaxID=2508882 RepID=UPI001035B1FB|nr:MULTISPECIES: SRPBCC family protein [unclassified Ornithinimicrobium]